ncbi:MFS transporter [Actinomadura sp. ATCC 39365]
MWTRDFVLFFTARTVSMLGSAMMPVATALGMHDAGYGATGVGLALAAWMVPMAGLILFGGVLMDRFTPRRMMVGADLARTATQAGTAALFGLGRPELWQVVALSAVAGAAAAMYTPGVAGTISRIAADVQRANATLRMSEAIMQLLGPGLAGALVGLAGVGVVFAADSAGFAVSAACLLLMRVRVARSGEEPVLVRLREGWREFRSRTWMWSVILIWVVFGITLFGPLIPLGSVLAAGGIGMFLFALEPLSFAAGLPLGVIMACHVVGGAGWAFWSVMWATSVQTLVPAEALNRVSAYEIGGSTMSLPVGQALAGPVAALVGSREVLGFSALVAVAGSLALLSLRPVRQITVRPREEDRKAAPAS